MLKDLFLDGAAFPAVVDAGRDDRAAAFAVSLVHHLPGRLRLRSAALKGNTCAGEDVRERLAAIAGIRLIAANPKTGSLLLEYDPAAIAPDRIIELLAPHGFNFSAAAAGTEAEPRLIDQLAGAIKDWALNALVKHLAFAIIGAIA